jgi:two-component system, LytTR family, response regulator
MKTIIIDDEPHCANLLAHLLRRHCPTTELVAQFTDPLQAIDYLQSEPAFDLLFLDVEMPKINAFDLLNLFYPFTFKVIFTTAYDRYALRAIKFKAFDYLLKPIDIEELKNTVFRAEQSNMAALPHALPVAHSTAAPAPTRIGLNTMEGIDYVEITQIVCCHADNSYTEVFTKDGKKTVISRNLKEMEDMLTGAGFFRIHHSHLVNMQHVRRYIRGIGGEVLMSNGQILPVARSKKDLFLTLIERM